MSGRSVKDTFTFLFGIDQQRFASKKQRLFYRTLRKRLTYGLMMLLVVCGIGTYAAFSGITPMLSDPGVTILLLNLDLVILLLLTVLLVRRVVSLWSGRKRGIAGSHLQVWLVYAFSFLAATPAIIMTLFSAFFFHYGVQSWFNERVQSAVESSSAVAEAYLEEHKQSIAGDARLMASEIDRWSSSLQRDDENLEELLFRQSFIFDLSEAMIFDEAGHVYARTGLTFSLEFEEVPSYAMRTADAGEIVILTSANENRVRALIKLQNESERFLYVGRMIDPQVLAYLNETRAASADYSNLRDRYGNFQIVVVMIFVAVGLVLVLIAIWLGLVLARRIALPISKLVTATDQVRSGDLSARMPEDSKLEEFDYLAKAFNRMTEQVEAQRGELLDTNRQLDERRRLTETVLRGVTSGVLGLDRQGVIRLANVSARKLLAEDKDKGGDAVGRHLGDVLPDAMVLLEQAHAQPKKIHEDEISIEQGERGKRIYLLRIAVEMHDEDDMRAILTFDDMTDLQKAQKAAAWSDVARRIAHEIKNPLTPIQLSAERLARKYAPQISEGRDVFEQCTDTIIKHVGDIGRMVDEFSSFARMPEPRLEAANIVRLIEESLFLQREGHAAITYKFDNHCENDLHAIFDHQQIRQVLTNLLQNAADSIEDASVKKGRVTVGLLAHDGMAAIVINDNGPGFPPNEHPQHLLEPYVTHKPKGTGLGLAIVKKIVDDHEGRLILGIPSWLLESGIWKDLGGATVIVLLPLTNKAAERENE